MRIGSQVRSRKIEYFVRCFEDFEEGRVVLIGYMYDGIDRSVSVWGFRGRGAE
jgi:hypothetical protein